MRLAPCLLLALLLSAAPLSAAETEPKAPSKTPDVVGKPITEARSLLLEAGWKPRPTYLPYDDERLERNFADAATLYDAGIEEVEICAGTGAAPCIFNYRRGTECLRVFTIGEFKKGEYAPRVVEQRSECPPKEALREPE